MALSQNVGRDLLLGDVEATETTVGGFISTASPAELRVVTAQGGAPAAAGDFMILQKELSGSLKSSRVINVADITSITASKHVAETQTQYTFSALPTPVVGDVVKLQVRVFNAGSASVNQWHNYIAEFVATDTSQETLVDGLIASFNANMATIPGATASTNPYFTVSRTGSTTTSALVIVAKEQAIDLGKDEGRRVEFIADLFELSTDGLGERTALGTSTKVGGTDGNGNGKQILNLEFFSKGNFGDIYRGMGYPNNFSTVSDTVLAADYHTIDIQYQHKGNGISVHEVPGTVTIAVEATDQDGGGAGTIFTEVNKIINNLEVASGFTIPDLS